MKGIGTSQSKSSALATLAVLACTVTASVPALREAVSELLGVTRVGPFDTGTAVAVLAVALLVQARARRHAAILRSATAAHEHQLARDLERMVASTVSLAGALDWAQLRVEAWRHVPVATGGRPTWIAVMTPQDWQWVVEPDAASAASWLDQAPRLWQLAEGGTRRYQGWRLFVLGGSGRAQGLLAVDDTKPLDPVEEQRLAWLSAMLGTVTRNVQHFEQLHMNCVSDALTGCFNRAHAFATLESELRRAKRTNRPLSVLMLDVDDFKRINDEHGHLSGDRVLESLGHVLRQTLRTSDVKCRYGGDEFLVILPETPSEGAEVVAEHLRRAVGRMSSVGRGAPFTVCASIGVASATPNETDALALVARADAALYRVKAQRSAALSPDKAADSRLYPALNAAS